ncbi:MAG TPA: SAM-dependent methyltransferase [Bacteroidales bacterium]|nr:SAM-dependent methyltransferase [Bacteroidales bacterium]
MKGQLYLVPVTLGDEDFQKVIPEKVLEIIRRLRFFIVEDLRSARRFLRLIDRKFPIDDSIFLELSEHTSDPEYIHYLDPVENGHDIGLLSEAGLPCIADPGSRIVLMAHEKKIKVTPLSGPSSIIMALISSGLNGQSFTFNGYLPVKPAELAAKIKEIEKKASGGYSQIFMETPYRAQKLFDTLITLCNSGTKLCIAQNLTLPDESICTQTIARWAKKQPAINDKLVVFVLQQ